jgi:hypothetical protein
MADEAAAEATAPCAPAGNEILTAAEDDPGTISTVAAVALGNCASIAACTAAVSLAVSGLAKLICVVTEVGVAAADASDVTAGDADVGDKLAPAKPLPGSYEANAAASSVLMAVEAAAAAASPVGPGGKVSRTPAVDDPGVTSTTAAVAVGYCASIAD